MSKLRPYTRTGSGDQVVGYRFWCSGCQRPHYFNLVSDGQYQQAVWQFDGNLESPTVIPSILVRAETRCHLFLRQGQIQFLSDCEHRLASKTIPLQEWPEGAW